MSGLVYFRSFCRQLFSVNLHFSDNCFPVRFREMVDGGLVGGIQSLGLFIEFGAGTPERFEVVGGTTCHRRE